MKTRTLTNRTPLGVVLTFLFLLQGSLLFGQATTPSVLGGPPNTSNTSTNIGAILNAPNPVTQPTIEQRTWFVNNNPSLSTLDSGTKSAIIYGGTGSGLLNSPYLPNGQSKPLYQNGLVTPNWYLPTTWPSTGMSWAGVQPNGFMPNSISTYSPYNPSIVSRPYPSVVNSQTVYRPIANIPTTHSQNTSRPGQSVSVNPSLVAPRLDGNNMSSLRPRGMGLAEAREHALSLNESAGDKVGQAINHSEIARLFIQEGEPERALVHVGIAGALTSAKEESRLHADLLQIRAAAEMELFDYEKSLEAYRQALPVLRSLKDNIGQAEVLASVGWIYQSLGETHNALECYKSAFRLFATEKNTDGQVRALIGVGSLYQVIGEPEKAYAEYVKAFPYASREQRARILVSVAELLQSRGEFSKAIFAYVQALVRTDEDVSLYAAIMAGLGRAHMAQGRYDLAQSDFSDALAKVQACGNREEEAAIRASSGELNYWRAISPMTANPKHQFSVALSDYTAALSLMRSVGNRNGEIGILTDIGLVYDARGKPNDALNYYMQALGIADELATAAHLEQMRINLADQVAGLYERTVLLEAEEHHWEKAFDLTERARARALLDQLGSERIGDARPASDLSLRLETLRRESTSLEHQLGFEFAKPAPAINTERLQSIQSRLDGIRKEFLNVLKDSKLIDSGHESFLNVSPLNLSEAQQQLRPDVTVISYYTTRESTLAFILTKDTFHATKLPVNELQLFVVLETLRDFSGGDEAPALRVLYKWLIAPIKSQIKTSMVAVVPHGVLHALPFAALTSDGREYFGDRHTIYTLPSVSVLPYLHPKMKASGDSLLVLANDTEPGLPQLKHAYNEAETVANIYGVRARLGRDATASVLRKEANSFDILHLIGHIALNDRAPELSRISTGEQESDDGGLELNKIYQLDLKKADLVVISGCSSLIGKRTRGDDITSLSRAFMYAGATSVIATLWDVDDEATKDFMIAFYTHLKAGEGKADALRAAQIEVRQKYPNPYYWAGFVLTGDPGISRTSNLVAHTMQ